MAGNGMMGGALFVTALLLLIAGCTSVGSGGTADQARPVVHEKFTTPNDTELKSIIAQFDTTAEKERQEWGVPGMAIAIVKDGKIIFAKGYGVKEAGKSDPVTNTTVFEIGSVSKSFTAALVAEQVDKGKMNWTDPVIWYVPDFQMKDPWVTREFTLTDAFAHRSGLVDNWGIDLALFGYNRSEMIHALRYAEPVSSFRSEFKYQNLPLLVAAAAVENTTNQSWEENLNESIFTPINLTSASTTYAALEAAPNHATPHRWTVVNGTLVATPIDPSWRFNTWTDTIGPAGGLNMNILDLATWAEFQMGNGSWNGKQIVSSKNMEYLHTPQILYYEENGGSKLYYCQGWEYEEVKSGPAIVMHDGSTIGGRAMVLLVPEKQLAVVVLLNAGEAGFSDSVARQFYNAYFGIDDPDLNENTYATFMAFNEPFIIPAKRPENYSTPLPLSRYTGSYKNDLYGTAVVSDQEGNLTLTFGKDPIMFVLSPWDGNTFVSSCPDYGPDYHGRVVFFTNPDGSVGGLSSSLIYEGAMMPIYNRSVAFVKA